ncbi:hypothetical protein [Paracoccus aminophilus]|uniref:hypothetical protein n=1 Tax=Paracoccus aminophilus TaxID=34003 RepID=UPI0005A007AF|nr:hypothetical protein [Paracoccus aminophilus]
MNVLELARKDPAAVAASAFELARANFYISYAIAEAISSLGNTQRTAILQGLEWTVDCAESETTSKHVKTLIAMLSGEEPAPPGPLLYVVK